MNNKTLETQRLESKKTPRQFVLQIPTNKLAILIPVLIVILIFTTASALGLGGGDRVLAQEGQTSSVGEPSAPQGVDSFSSTGTISFQGELRDTSTGAALPDGDYKMRFAIYDAASGGNKHWPAPSPDYEDHLGVGVEDGLFNVLLGSQIAIPPSAFDSGGDRYLQIWVCETAGSGCTTFDDLGRLPISSAAYTMGIVPGTVVNSASGFGLRVNNSGVGGSALEGHATSTTGITWGVVGSTASGSDLAAGVFGSASADNGETFGVYGSSVSSDGVGVYGTAPVVGIAGHASINSGSAYGVFGSSSSSEGIGVKGIASMTGTVGIATASSGVAYGVYGQNASYNGAGVYGTSTNTSGTGVKGDSSAGSGVYGSSTSGIGVGGYSGSGDGLWGYSTSGSGVYGTANMTGTVGIATATSGTTYGVYGQHASISGAGVYGESTSGNGVEGNSDSGTGLLGSSTSGDGVSGTSTSGSGVYGSADGDDGVGVYGTAPMTGTVGIATDDTGVGVSGIGGHSGVRGEGAITGIYGKATATGDLSTVGVMGENWSDGSWVAAVYGKAHGSSAAVKGYSVNGIGIIAKSDNGDIYHGYGDDSFDLEFKVTNAGEVYADGSFHSGGADFAELLPANEGLEPGDVLVIGLDGQLARSAEANQPTVVGVYSTEPGFLGGSADDTDTEGKVPLAVVGVVPVKVSAENGAIQPGDMLVASATPGHAMKAGSNPQIGTVIGKALESITEGTGIILMLVILQ